MKKLLGIILSVCFLALPVITYAAETVDISKYETTNLTETLESEEMEAKFKDYSEGEEKINIYLFRGLGCTYCRNFLTYLNGITEKYGKYFNLVAFESWYNADNAELLENVSAFLEQEAGGVPYIIIGDQVFPGYAEDYNDAIESAIKDLYNTKEADRYDVFEAYNESIEQAKKLESRNQNRVIIYCLAFDIIAVAAVCFFVNYSNKKVLEALRPKNVAKEIVNDIADTVEKKQEEVKKAVKKVVKKSNLKK